MIGNYLHKHYHQPPTYTTTIDPEARLAMDDGLNGSLTIH